MTYSRAQRIRESADGHILGTHFATPASRCMVINGFSLSSGGRQCGGVPVSAQELHGYGGGSFCNYSEQPNARLVRDSGSTEADGYGLFVVANKFIKAGEFITVDYGSTFLSSSKSNISHI